jgi:hypothetical protein
MVQLDKVDHSTLLPRITALRLKWPANSPQENSSIPDTHSIQQKPKQIHSQGDPKKLLREVNSWFPDSHLPEFPK